MLRREFVVLAGLSPWMSWAAPVVTAKADTGDDNDLINKAGMLRALSQRTAKAWLALGLGLDPQRSKSALDASIKQTNVLLAGIVPKVQGNEQVAATYASLTAVWKDYAAALSAAKFDAMAAQKVVAGEGRMLQLAQQGVTQLEVKSPRSSARLVALSGRQRMLSQRMAKYYLMRLWSLDVKASDAELTKAHNEFNTALKVLTQAPENTAAIRNELALVSQQWVFFENALKQSGTDAVRNKRAMDVLASSENIYSEMDLITGLYAKL